MKLFRYLLLIFLLWNIPTFFSYDVSIGSKLSYAAYILLIIYYLFVKKNKPLTIFFILGLFYYVISGAVYVEEIEFYYYGFIKFFILILAGAELMRNTNNAEFFCFLILGSTSIIIHATLFQNDYGRYSGFYLDPNAAGFVCLLGYAQGFSIKNTYFKLIGQFILTFAGILTFSRTFILLWFLVSVISVFANRKNAVNFGVGAAVLVIVLSIASILQLNAVRFQALESFLGNNPKSSARVIQTDSRFDTWAVYYDMILNNPYFGNGYKTLSGYYTNYAGVHNTFLMILGESGIFTFFVFCFIYFGMLFKGFAIFKFQPFLFMMVFTLMGSMLTVHNYFENFVIMLTSFWLFIRINESQDSISSNQLIEKGVKPVKNDHS
ncbi:O-antigen ligase family protein [Paucihalobacter sp.]|uniref:O-antigen ligase family protein n=1 Tax=Paucihalobacter sp. TaxID=2850405 RepID=UPI003D16059D